LKQVPATQGKLDFHRQEDEETARNAHENAASERDASAGFSYLGTLRQQFALFETPEGLVLMHPKAARERIIFERLRARREAPMPSQQLLDPVVLDLDPRDFAVIRQFAPHFDQAGMVVTPFGQNTIRIESIPALLELENAVISGKFVYTVFSAVYDGIPRELSLLERYIGRVLDGDSADTDRYLMRIRRNLQGRIAGIDRSRSGDPVRRTEYETVVRMLEMILEERGYHVECLDDLWEAEFAGTLCNPGELG